MNRTKALRVVVISELIEMLIINVSEKLNAISHGYFRSAKTTLVLSFDT